MTRKKMIYKGYGKKLFLSLTKEWKGRYSYIGIFIISFFHFFISPMTADAQIKIGGNVYGGGNHADVHGSTKVTVKAGDIGAFAEKDAAENNPRGRVFGGARMANIGGNSYVNIDGANATDYIVINQVYGGNDIAGTIGTAAAVGEEIPAELSGNPDGVDNTWNSYVHLSTRAASAAIPAVYYTQEEIDAAHEGDDAYGKTTSDIKTPAVPAVTQEKVFIGQLFAGGNGDFDYEQTPGPGEGQVTHTIYNRSDKDHETPLATLVTPEGEVGFQLPETDKAYLDIQGGTIAFAYGGGSNATVKKKTIIHVDNPSDVVTDIKVNAETGLEDDDDGVSILTNTRVQNGMGIRMAQEHFDSPDFQIGRLFGGNNLAEMAIRPTWNLQTGKIRNLYSGGNRGNMTSPEGLLLEIDPKVPDGLTYEEEQAIKKKLVIDNVYGGCRMADVTPTVNGVYTPCTNLQDKDESGNLKYFFPNELSARTLVRGGDINNVYGGNDVTGTVNGGNAVGIYTSIRGDVYGGGNGGYAYTDMPTMQDDEVYGDFYYSTEDYPTSYDALNAFRPNAEQVSIRLKGTDGRHPTIIKGSVYCGGNCASLATKKSKPMVELKIGSYVIADNVFLGNNGEKMIDPDVLKLYNDDNFSTLDLADKSTFANYMEGVAMTLQPNIVFDNVNNSDPENYVPYTSYVGSFFCGGNVGSMAIEGKEVFTVDQGLNIYEKFVGGCNNAYVEEIWTGENNTGTQLCASYEGGVLGTAAERSSYTDEDGNIKDRLEINLENLTITPLRWKDEEQTQLIWNTNRWEDYSLIEVGTVLKKDDVYYTYNSETKEYTKHTVVSDYTVTAEDKYYEVCEDFVPIPNNAVDADTRLLGGNIYGGCYNSGHVNGNIVININEDVLKRDEVFGDGVGPYGNPASGVELENQRDDLMAVALILFGGGYGKDTEVWGSTTVNHNNGYVFQICGGGEMGMIGKPIGTSTEEDGTYDDVNNWYFTNGKKYEFNPAYSCTVNLNGSTPVYSSEEMVEDLAETEYIYGGGKEGDVCGNTLVNLGYGRLYDAFAGASEANILGHSEAYIGRQPNGSGGYKDGFPWIKDIVYGGNDYCGTIYGNYEEDYDFKARLRDYDTDKTQLHGYNADKDYSDVLKSSTYVEYLMGRVDTIFGGGYGYYDYKNEKLFAGDSMPEQHSSFVNIRPKDHGQNYLRAAFGGGTGFPGIRENDGVQDRSYVLIDIPDDMTKFTNMEVFGSGSYNGIGMNAPVPTADPGESGTDEEKQKYQAYKDYLKKPDEYSAIIDLLRGRIHNVYGGSYNEGVTRKTVVNVPAASSIQLDSIYGGAYGTQILPPCDVYETQVNYKNTSENAQVFGAIFGGNNNERRSIFTQVNISSPVWQNKDKGYTGTVFGAGRGVDTWSEYTEVNLLSGAKVYNAYGGGELGHVLNSASIQAYQNLYVTGPSPQISHDDPNWSKAERWTGEVGKSSIKPAYEDQWAKDWADAWTIGSYYTPVVDANEDGIPESYDYTKYATNTATSLAHVSNRAELDDKTAGQLDGKKYNTNVIVNKGAIVEGYAYGGGLGDASVHLSGDVYGTSYVAVLGGEVMKDVYAGGRAGGLDNLFGATSFSGGAFTASANAYVQGGTARNVYGGGYLGHVGHHAGDITTDFTGDRLAKANVVIGKTGTNTYDGGAPAITRNVYGGGEGGSVYGTSKITLNNGYIGYRYKNTGTKYEYVEELDDQKPNDIDAAGNVFGGGYVINSYVDNSIIDMYGGQVRGSLFGGGEIGPIGRGANKTGYSTGMRSGDAKQSATIFRAGTTNVSMYDGKVLRNVFGGGRGKDSWGGDGTLYMDPDTVAKLTTMGLMCKGYVFGQTKVNIYGGEIGTDEGMAYGYGNVFGGCDEGTVYSAMMDGNNLRIGKKNGERYKDATQGYYFLNDGTSYIMNSGDYIFTEDCSVLVEPHSQTLIDMTIPNGGGTYKTGDYIPTSDLNKLKNKETDASYWDFLDSDGIIIHNAVFAGGNIATGSSSMYANATTVYGNASATIHDVYNRDLITIGTGHTGGLYGDGNLTFVDGYRELNITNYGTDYYNIASELSYEEYKELPVREQAYYELKYSVKQGKGPVTDIYGTTYTDGSSLPQDEIIALFAGTEYLADGKPNSTYWQENGVVSVYAGRIMNTIQRADLCGVFGSRMVMKGAQDRVPEKADYTNYTINRVREVSLNKKASIAGDPATVKVDDKDVPNPNYEHGNYFGIYNVVNYLGALTSDVRFTDERKTNSDDPLAKADGSSYYDWKGTYWNDKKRNNGTCHNKLALASGVYLELTTEKSTGRTLNEKDWGPITGVVELDLINVQPGIGGGFVYAKNIHGIPTDMRETRKTTTMSTLNKGAATQWDYDYSTTEDDTNQKHWETSGNFIHSSQRIIDDCYNVSSKYMGAGKVPAHYWYIWGNVYVYDQYISAYTGTPNAYRETVEIPITVSAASNGKMILMDVQPNLYAYYSSFVDASNNTPLTGDNKLVINDVTYQLNDPISYWDWSRLPEAEQKLFVSDTYVLKDSCYINSKYYPAGYIMLASEYEALKPLAVDRDVDGLSVKAVQKATKNAEGVSVVEKDRKGNDVYVAFDDAFRSSNNMSHDTGYLLTYDVTNPGVWDQWYTLKNSEDRAKKQKITKDEENDYHDGPTYHPIESGVYGQHEYSVNDIISDKIYKEYQALTNKPAENQATFVPAHLVTKEYTSPTQHYYPGAPVSAAISGYTSSAYVSTATIQLSATEYIYVNDLMTEAQKTAYYNRFKDGTTEEKAIAADINDLILPAYYCTQEGLYGGSYYENTKNYRALEAYSAMSEADRQNFTFNYDALDLLVDPNYGGLAGQKYQYDSAAATKAGAEANDATYSLTTPIDYKAIYTGENGESRTLPFGVSIKRGSTNLDNITTLIQNDTLTSKTYESLPNEQRHYAAISVKAGTTDCYVVKESFVHGNVPYAVGATIDNDIYNNVLVQSEKENFIATLTFPSAASDKTYYYCREEYSVGDSPVGVTPTQVSITGTTGGIETRDDGKVWVKVGTVINAVSDGNNKGYDALPNYQTYFTIQGESPMESSTLFVARNADINDLSTEKIITVIYKYDYEESDGEGSHITPITERHVVNIHIKFKSGVPTVEDINPPTIVLPGTSITMRVPSVTPGAYEVTGGGWELFDSESDAESHVNGMPYTPSVDSLYWYQDGFYLSYYAKTYMGKTYSNHVPVSVANYHDLKKVMDDKKYHLHVDYDRTRLKRDSKIYINDYSSSSQNGLDLFKNFYDWSLITSSTPGITIAGDSITNAGHKLKGHHLMNTVNGPTAGKNLEFFLRTDIAYKDNPATDDWTPIGNDEETCFKGILHGDGHTISGLDHSLFNNLCGDVYNLGVTGSFNSAGVADEGSGYVESAWVKTTNATSLGTKPYAVFGKPTDTKGYQIVNSYFYDGNNSLYNTTTSAGITTSGGARGVATAKSAQEFYNGTVAYDLNNFYLYKRYHDGVGTSAGADYRYWKQGETELESHTGYYASNAELCSSGYVDDKLNVIKYVEDRFADGDFRYAAGEIPLEEDERNWIDTEDENKSYYFPIWPDDYIFFGQKLTYGWAAEAHQDVPTAVVRDDGRLSLNDDANRVYRAPAYYRSKDMGVYHFNPNAYLAQKSYDGTKTAYPGMTAIDFKGHYYAPNEGYGVYGLGTVTSGLPDGKKAFYTPLLDDDGLTSITNCDETQNLLVYAPSAEANAQTLGVLDSYFKEPAYSAHYDNSEGYRLVDEASTASIHGHLVQYDKTAYNDHLLVDKQDFNAPIAYSFDADHLMWYQRIPANNEYVDHKNGWQGISVPFTAELVTTNQKGEITHFYSGSGVSQNGTKKGHEYWLRQFEAIKEDDSDPENIVARGTFNYPTASGNPKTVTNDFLWDYYYKNEKVHNQKDEHADTYLEYKTYYKENRTYTAYPLLQTATPYILGLPGETYYEFDLSGKFEAKNTANRITRLGKQVITLASSVGTSIGVSDNEMAGVTQTESATKSYSVTFKPSYMNETLENGNYVMNSDGNAYVKLDNTGTSKYFTTSEAHTFADADALSAWKAANYTLYTDADGITEATTASGTEVTYYKRVREITKNDNNNVTPSLSAFRPYFSVPVISGARAARRFNAKKIVFDGVNGEFGDGPETVLDGSLEIYTRGYKIYTTSHMTEATTIRIVNASGATITNYVLQPGETIETPVAISGVYVVNKKKVFVE